MNASLLNSQDSYALRMRLTTLLEFEHQQRVLQIGDNAKQRRERIATACIQGLLATGGESSSIASRAVKMADALIAELDRPPAASGENPGKSP